MTREETIQLLMTMQAAYPNYKVQDKTIAVNMWHTMLEEYDVCLIMASLKTFIATDKSGFAPSIGQLLDKANMLMKTAKNEESLTDAQAWSLVSKALRNSTYNSKAEFEKLPADVQDAVGSHNILYQWAMDEHFNESVVSSNFMRSYQQVKKRKENYAMLPESIKQAIGIATNNTEDKNKRLLNGTNT